MIVSPFVQLPLNVGFVLFVMLSVLLEPVSVAAVMSGAARAAGAVVSIVMERLELWSEVLPAASVCTAVTLCAPPVIAKSGAIV